jgi:hypothetical protein
MAYEFLVIPFMSLIAWGYFSWAMSVQKRHDLAKPRQRSEVTTPIPATMRQMADKQAKSLEARKPIKSECGMTLIQFLDIAARELMRLWPWMDYAHARREIIGSLEMADMVFPDLDYDWTPAMAKEIAREYALDYGEEYGSNA